MTLTLGGSGRAARPLCLGGGRGQPAGSHLGQGSHLDTPASFACATSLLSWPGRGVDYSPGARGSRGLCKARLQLETLSVRVPALREGASARVCECVCVRAHTCTGGSQRTSLFPTMLSLLSFLLLGLVTRLTPS